MVERDGDWLSLEYEIAGEIDVLGLSFPTKGKRVDDLWKTTCFEAFRRKSGAPSYEEFNFAPSGDWAAYRFDDYRTGRTDLDFASPIFYGQKSDEIYTFGTSIPLSKGWWQLSLTAVIEEIDGTKSYWALRHPPGAPDFHHADCFALELPALGRL